MLILKAKIREEQGKKVKKLRKRGILPAVLYGPKIKNLSLEIDLKEFENIYKETGESSLISLEVDPSTGSSAEPSTRAQAEGAHSKSSGQVKKFPVLIHEVKKDPLTGKPIHIDFYQPILTEEVEATVSIVFEGEAPAVKEFGGTLVREISEVEVKALPQNLPHEIKVNVENLKTFEDEILIKDLKLPEKVKVQREPDEIVAVVTPLEKVEEELEKPVEEKVEEVEKVEEEKEEEEGEEEKADGKGEGERKERK